ncbi:MAG TPA: OsmC family protein [Actinophytocola sp.]|jgi:organic hydroperoxide reductase OsmC/OhrA|uniref:OsmC family protein n=1 Tax=Actinophytocola sp. TaxID=1872138 RepID=UPI002DFBF60C|nr:OsmC family protein [Actinophytocola sp.]
MPIPLIVAVGRGPLGTGERAKPALTTRLFAPLPGPTGRQPQQSYGTALVVCFFRALAAAATRHGVRVDDASVTVEVGIDGTVAAPRLTVEITVAVPGVPQQLADRLVIVAERTCPFVTDGRRFGTIDVRTTEPGASSPGLAGSA